MSETPSCCQCCTSFIFTLGLTSLFMWLSLRPSSPSFYIKNFYAPALNTTTTNTTAATISNICIDFQIENPNKDKRVYYDALNITLNYYQNQSIPVGNASIPEFKQGHHKKARKPVTVQPVEISWEDAVKKVSSNGTVRFTVYLATSVRYKIIFWITGRHRMKVHADVNVGKQGKQIEEKWIKLKSAAHDGGSRRPCFSGLSAFFFVLLAVW